MAFAGLAGAVGAYLQGKRQRQMQDQQLQLAQQRQQTIADQAAAQTAEAERRAALEEAQLRLQQTKAGLFYKPTTTAPPATPGIAAGPGAAPKLQSLADVMGGGPTQAPPTPSAPTTTAAPAATPGQPAAPHDSLSAWNDQAQQYQAQAVALYQQAEDLEKQATDASNQGATEIASRLQAQANGMRQQGASFVALSTSLQTRAHQANQDAVAFSNAAERMRHDRAQEAHWSKQLQQQAKAETDRIAVEVRNGSLTYQAALARVAATYAGIDAANQRSAASIGAANDRAAAGRAVTIRGQNLTNSRATAAAAATAANRSNSAGVKALQSSTIFTGLPPAVQSYISASVQKNGVEKVNAVLKAIAAGTTTDPNITQQQAQQAARAMGVQTQGDQGGGGGLFGLHF